jgi:hypothetical protein
LVNDLCAVDFELLPRLVAAVVVLNNLDTFWLRNNVTTPEQKRAFENMVSSDLPVVLKQLAVEIR